MGGGSPNTEMKKEIELSSEFFFDILRIYSRRPLSEDTRTRIYRRVLAKAHETAVQLMLPGFETLPSKVLSSSNGAWVSLFSQQSNICFDSGESFEEPVFVPEQQMELPFHVSPHPN